MPCRYGTASPERILDLAPGIFLSGAASTAEGGVAAWDPTGRSILVTGAELGAFRLHQVVDRERPLLGLEVAHDGLVSMLKSNPLSVQYLGKERTSLLTVDLSATEVQGSPFVGWRRDAKWTVVTLQHEDATPGAIRLRQYEISERERASALLGELVLGDAGLHRGVLVVRSTGGLLAIPVHNLSTIIEVSFTEGRGRARGVAVRRDLPVMVSALRPGFVARGATSVDSLLLVALANPHTQEVETIALARSGGRFTEVAAIGGLSVLSYDGRLGRLLAYSAKVPGKLVVLKWRQCAP